MSTGAFHWYRSGLKHLAAGDIKWAADTINVMLATVAYVPNQDTHEFRAAVTNEVSGTGYTAGGVALASKAVDVATSKVVRLIADDVAIPASTIPNARVAVIYKVVGTAATDILIGYAVVDADASSSSGTMTLDFDNANGILTLTAS